MQFVYQLMAPVYGWDEGTFTIGIFRSFNSAMNKAKSHYVKYYTDKDSDDVDWSDVDLFTRSVDSVNVKGGITYVFDHEDDWHSFGIYDDEPEGMMYIIHQFEVQD